MNNIDFQKVGKRIKTQREELGLTQREVAKRINIDASLICRYESGTEMNVNNLAKIASCLHSSIDYLIFGEGEHSTEPINDVVESAGTKLVKSFDIICTSFKNCFITDDYNRKIFGINMDRYPQVVSLIEFINNAKNNTVDFYARDTQESYKKELMKYAKKFDKKN